MDSAQPNPATLPNPVALPGLSSVEAAIRLTTDGPNALPPAQRRAPLRIIVNVLHEPMLALLLGGGVVYLLLGNRAEALILLAFACMSITITAVQEARTKPVLDALRDLACPRALVIRGGERQRIAGTDVVCGDLIAAGNTAQIADPAFITELKHWMRFTPRHAMDPGDGLFGATSGNSVMPDWLGRLLLDWAYTAEAENKTNAAKIASCAGLAVFVVAKDDAEHWVQAGRACQCFALQATVMGLKQAFLNQPVEVTALRPKLAALIGVPGRRPELVMRFGRGAGMPYTAPRPVDAVLL